MTGLLRKKQLGQSGVLLIKIKIKMTYVTGKEVENELKKIISWIIENNEEREAIDKINSVTFPFTSKYLGYEAKKRSRVPDNYDFDSV